MSENNEEKITRDDLVGIPLGIALLVGLCFLWNYADKRVSQDRYDGMPPEIRPYLNENGLLDTKGAYELSQKYNFTPKQTSVKPCSGTR